MSIGSLNYFYIGFKCGISRDVHPSPATGSAVGLGGGCLSIFHSVPSVFLVEMSYQYVLLMTEKSKARLLVEILPLR